MATELEQKVIEAAREIDFVFGSGTGPVEQVIHRNDLRGLSDALAALDAELLRLTYDDGF